MTTPKSHTSAVQAEPEVADRVKRRPPLRAAANRTPEDPGAARHTGAGGANESVSESVADIVRMGYDVVAENIRQGRTAAERFRQGEYNIRDVPADVETLVKRMIDLARDLSTVSFDIAERVLRETAPSGRHSKAPVFYPAPGEHSHRAAHAAQRPSETQALMHVTCAFSGERRAVLRSAALTRPTEPTFAHEHISFEALQSTVGWRPITGVTCRAHPMTGGLQISVSIPDDQPAGVYSGVVHGPHQAWPLGVLAIEVLP